ncbi:hypothetical protein [Mucilaginibacter humi]|uniref:hypothetical protein n=1 Tax=Mucilaginibacter humi TaxID=2732510 RepID=UPI001FE60101|nr:hypothetical protein [Mucilaginibacter humi]
MVVRMHHCSAIKHGGAISSGKVQDEKSNYARIKPIIDACKILKQTRTGALIVFAKYYDEQFYQNSLRDGC